MNVLEERVWHLPLFLSNGQSHRALSHSRLSNKFLFWEFFMFVKHILHSIDFKIFIPISNGYVCQFIRNYIISFKIFSSYKVSFHNLKFSSVKYKEQHLHFQIMLLMENQLSSVLFCSCYVNIGSSSCNFFKFANIDYFIDQL